MVCTKPHAVVLDANRASARVGGVQHVVSNDTVAVVRQSLVFRHRERQWVFAVAHGMLLLLCAQQCSRLFACPFLNSSLGGDFTREHDALDSGTIGF